MIETAYEMKCAWRCSDGSGHELADLLAKGWKPFQVDPADAEGDRLVWLRRCSRRPDCVDDE